MDAPLKAKSGHQGTAMALAPLAHVLYSRVMKHDPTDALWPDRDRFVLSAGHASILQYSMRISVSGILQLRVTPSAVTQLVSKSPLVHLDRASLMLLAWR